MRPVKGQTDQSQITRVHQTLRQTSRSIGGRAAKLRSSSIFRVCAIRMATGQMLAWKPNSPTLLKTMPRMAIVWTVFKLGTRR